MEYGEITQIGSHRLLRGDSTNQDHINKLMEGRKCDICITDPPYLATNLDMDKEGIDLKLFGECIKNNMKINAHAFIFGTPNVYKIISDILHHRFEYIWHKSKGPPQRPTARYPVLNHEICWAFIHPDLKRITDTYMNKVALRTKGDPYSRKHPSINQTDFSKQTHGYRPSETINDGHREGMSVIQFKSKSAIGTNMFNYEQQRVHSNFGMITKHPTQKPQQLYELLLNGYCIPKGLLYEPCGGSGTGMAAAQTTGHTCYMIEKESKYCDMIIERMKKIQMKLY